MTDVIAFPRYQIEDIPNSLRQLANRIEHGDISALRCVIAMESENTARYFAFGLEPFTRAHAAGLCFAVATDIVSGKKVG